MINLRRQLVSSSARIAGLFTLTVLFSLTACSSGTVNSSPSSLQEQGQVVSTMLLQNNGSSPYNKMSTAQAADVQWVFMTWPIPTGVVSSPLIGGRDDARIEDLLDWLAEARHVDSKGLSSPRMGRSMAVNVAFRNNQTLVIRPAWSCDQFQDEQGNSHLSCTPKKGHVWIGETESNEAYFAESEQLYQFVNEGYKTWMPPVKPYEVPSTIQPNAPFAISGQGARSASVTVALMKGNDTLWEGKSDVKEGEWAVSGIAPDHLPDGKDYNWKIQMDTGGYGISVDVNR